MKLQIEKQPHGTIKVIFLPDAGKKPVVVEITPVQLPLIISLLQAAGNAQHFTFQLEL